ncbi:MAG: hypothetical protein IIY28_00750 [Lachnospiraceae bacterium]|nr:hypothetical protein [Lachnospiraceae bacterium]
MKLLKNCPLDNGYEHTIFFDTPLAQEYYFTSQLPGYTFERMSYQRVNKGMLRVQMNAEQLYNVNYMAFRNTAFGNKWFYAFVNKVEYVNNITTEISYEIDIIQTWFFQFKIPSCFVERIHAATDEPGDNLVPEGLETGEYVIQSSGVDLLLEPLSLVIAATFDEQLQDVSGGIYSQLFTGLYYNVFPMGYYAPDDPDHPGEYGPYVAMQFISSATTAGKSGGIVSMFMMPSCMVTANGAGVFPAYHIVSRPKAITGDIDGYTPKNKKLYTYPYNFLYVTNFQGNGSAFPYEYFSGQTCDFDVSGDMSPNPSVLLRPVGYKGSNLNTDEKMVLTGYPQVPYNIDAFKAWLAMNATNLAVDALSNAGAVAAAGIGGNLMGAASGVMGVGRLLGNVYQHSILPPQAKGGGGSITTCALRIQNFGFYRKTIKAEFARIIDDFFTMYGYACHKVMVPNRKVRPEWTYIKTVNCKVEPGYPTDAILQGTAPEAGLPAEDARRIEQIHNNGITYWVVPGHLGDYMTYPNDLPVTAGTEGGGSGGEQTEP